MCLFYACLWTRSVLASDLTLISVTYTKIGPINYPCFRKAACLVSGLWNLSNFDISWPWLISHLKCKLLFLYWTNLPVKIFGYLPSLCSSVECQIVIANVSKHVAVLSIILYLGSLNTFPRFWSMVSSLLKSHHSSHSIMISSRSDGSAKSCTIFVSFDSNFRMFSKLIILFFPTGLLLFAVFCFRMSLLWSSDILLGMSWSMLWFSSGLWTNVDDNKFIAFVDSSDFDAPSLSDKALQYVFKHDLLFFLASFLCHIKVSRSSWSPLCNLFITSQLSQHVQIINCSFLSWLVSKDL